MSRKTRGRVVDFFFLAFYVLLATTDFESHNWLFAAMWTGLALFFVWCIHHDWPKPKSDEDLNKTKELKDIWKDKV